MNAPLVSIKEPISSYRAAQHTFVVCAYGKSPYLEESVVSLLRQTVKSHILMATFTPNKLICACAEKYGVPLLVNTGKAGISGDWNFALSCAQTALVTLAHQDDLYEPAYTEEMLRAMNAARDPLVFFSDYAELRGKEKVIRNRLLRIKRFLLLPVALAPSSKAARRLSLAFGNPICCPSVTYRREIIAAHPFQEGFKSNLDWQQWECLSDLEGSFVYCRAPLMCHRIHEGSETSRLLENDLRRAEDYAMFRRFWPRWMAKLLAKLYAASYRSNQN